ncbi:MAG: hypothetical protein LBR42_04085, partial [Candidatus Methanoplasma sp.]|nr:hypothetical protein [Candidatus Methanoplasma sp.]
MPDETNDQLGREGVFDTVQGQDKDGSEVKKTDDRGMEGQVSAHNAATQSEQVSRGAGSPEEEPVGAGRPEPRAPRKMNAADFRVKQEPKPEPKPQTPEPEPRTEPPQDPVRNEPVREPIAATPVDNRSDQRQADEPAAKHEP